ncbi:hypothetical protein [Comamonas testosteroni]|jgi:hypothetical protein|uniref:hypothetical protein n=1 Tax=Comamonas testosteroni TaxID=285 RepID=UPI0026E98CE2|nr:hypothetical protein [Comamonas testosteroni]
MRKVKPNELATLPEEERRLLFNYFGALERPAMYRKQAVFGGVFGCVLVTFTFVIDAALLDLQGVPEWFASFHMLARIAFGVMTAFWVFWRLRLAKSSDADLSEMASELNRHELDVSGVTQDQVFETVVLPMLRRSGLHIKE